MFIRHLKNKKITIGLLLFCLIIANIAILPKVFAGTLTNTSLIEMGGVSNVSPMVVGDGQSLAIAFTTVNATSTSPSITITFTGWTGGTSGIVNATQTVSNTGCTALTGASAGLPGTLTASGSGDVITISTTSALSATTSYCTELTSPTAVTNPTTVGDYSVTINDSVDSEIIGIDVLSAGGNAYSITATISPTFTMSLSSTTDSFTGALSPTAVTTSTGITTTINTNAKDGWFVWVRDSNAGLTSVQAGHTIPSVATGTNYNFSGNTGSDNYGLGVSAYNTANYAYSAGTTGSGMSNTTYNEIATNNTTASNLTFVTHELANISPLSPVANDYTDTITEIGAGSF